MRGQLYIVPISEDDRHDVEAGQFVYSGHDYDEVVIGFVNDFNPTDLEMEICLFEPREMPDTVLRVVEEELPEGKAYVMLGEICDLNPRIRQAWVEAVGRSQLQ